MCEERRAWAQMILERMLAAVRAGRDPLTISIGIPSEGELNYLEIAVEHVNEKADIDSPTAETLLAALVRHPLVIIACAAMRGLYHLGCARSHIQLFREHANDARPAFRDAAAWGLGASHERVDEDLLWALMMDSDDDVKMSAAYALRDMPRQIDAHLFEDVIGDLSYGGHLGLAERALRDHRLFDFTRAALSRQWPEIKESGWHKWVPGLAEGLGIAD